MVSQTMSDNETDNKTATVTEDGTRIVPMAVFRETHPDAMDPEARATYYDWSEDENVPFRAVEDIDMALMRGDEWASVREDLLADLKAETEETGNVDAKRHVANVHVHEVTSDNGVCGDYEIEWVIDVPEDAPRGRYPDDSRKSAEDLNAE